MDFEEYRYVSFILTFHRESKPIRHVILDPIYPYPYRVVITTFVAEQLDTYPDQ